MLTPNIQIHHYKVDAADYVSEVNSPILSTAETARAARFINERHKVIYMAIHRFLRIKLAGYLCVEPADIVFKTGEYGKPFIVSPKVANTHFNLSYRCGNALLVIADCEVGIDIEQIRPIDDIEAFCTAYFHPNERAIINQSKPSEQPKIIFTFWAFKEAFIKMLGIGFSRDLTEFDLSPFYHSPTHSLTFMDGRTFTIERVNVPKGYTGAIAIENKKRAFHMLKGAL